MVPVFLSFIRNLHLPFGRKVCTMEVGVYVLKGGISLIHALEFTIKLLIATLLFLPRGKRNQNYWSILLMTGLAVWIMSIAVDAVIPKLSIPFPYSNILHFSTSYFMIFVVVLLSHALGISESLYAANTGFAVQNAWHCISSLILMLPGICKLAEKTQYAEAIISLPFILICWYGTLELRKHEILERYRRPVVIAAFAILFLGFIRYEQHLSEGAELLAYFMSLAVSLLVILIQYGAKKLFHRPKPV